MPQNNKPQIQQPSPRTTIISVVLFLLVAFFVGQQFMSMSESSQGTTDKLVASEFLQAVDQNRVTEVTYSAGDYTVSGTYYPAVTAGDSAADAFNSAIDAMNAGMATLKDPNTGKPLSGVGTQDIESQTLGQEHKFTCTWAGSSLSDLMAQHPEIKYEVKTPSPWGDILTTLLPIILIGAMLFFLFNQMAKANNSQMNFGKAKAKQSIEERPDVRFADVAGVDEAVEEMQEIKDFLANPAKYQSMGAKIPRGCLLVGPPGTGKTLLAKAVAGEAGVGFLSISGSDFVELYVGVGASRVRDLFEQAKKQSPAIVFIDEIDAVGRQRGTGLGGGHDEREQTLNQLLVEMDGFAANEGVVVLAATNRADVLDPALLRPGRFDRQVYVGLPDIKGREEILKVHAKGKPLAEDVSLRKLAQGTAGFTGADLENLINEGALLAARKDQHFITMQDLKDAEIKVIAGPEKKSRVIPQHERELTAYHEAGHAVVMHMLPGQDPVSQITIVPRGMAGGMTISLPEEDRSYLSKHYMEDQIVGLLGGRVAEKLCLNDISTGASNDIQRATAIARKMVTVYGMSERLGTVSFDSGNDEVFIGRTMGHSRGYSEAVAAQIDQEVKDLVDGAYRRCQDILEAQRDKLEQVAQYLLEHETMERDAFLTVFGEKTHEQPENVQTADAENQD